MTVNLDRSEALFHDSSSSYLEPHKGIFRIAHNLNIEEYSRKNVIKTQSTPKVIVPPSRCCPECDNTTSWVNDDLTGDTICGQCGLVLEEKCIDHGKEWRSYDMSDEASRSRVGPKRNLFMYDGGLSTTIDMSCRDSRGQSLSPAGRLLQRRLKRTHDRYRTSGSPDRNFTDAMGELNVFTQTFKLSTQVKTEVAIRYKKIVKDQSLKGRTIRSILLALIYIIRAEQDYPLTVSEVCEKGKIGEPELTSYRKKVYKALHLKPLPLTPDKFINTIHNALHIDRGTAVNLSKVFYKRILKLDPIYIQGKDPAGIAAGLYYLSCFILNYDCTQHQIREVLHVTDVTVRNRYREMSKKIFSSEHSVLQHLRKIISRSNISKEKTQKFVDSLFLKI